MVYTKEEYLADIQAVGEIDSKTNHLKKKYWLEQYNLWASGERDLVDDIAAAFLSEYSSFQSNGLTSLEIMEGGFNASGNH